MYVNVIVLAGAGREHDERRAMLHQLLMIACTARVWYG
jgi:hypothetical protein